MMLLKQRGARCFACCLSPAVLGGGSPVVTGTVLHRSSTILYNMNYRQALATFRRTVANMASMAQRITEMTPSLQLNSVSDLAMFTSGFVKLQQRCRYLYELYRK